MTNAFQSSELPDPASAGRGGPAWKSPGAWGLLLGTIAVGLAADLATKWWAFHSIASEPVEFTREQALSTIPLSALLPMHRPVVAIPSILNFTLVLNPGAVFGIGAGRVSFFIGVTMAAIAFGVGVFVFAMHARDRLSHAGLGLILAGGLGNLYDRLVFGCVRDFIHPLPRVKWPGTAVEVWPYVSNVADLLLLIGIGLLLVHAWTADRRHRRSGPVVHVAAPADSGSAG